ncbi:hypothetical protein SELMODRAFT_77396 [Selaginella moellendorffii]|uniref:Pentacotripeptide-repeat region of PRORP domain-containing protein n=1 Tax=Selaginella moellendorffii TaxID=88036 RepID=D8QRU5_SELML|nr:hypothetical protein SELMODRAFT_77396 [Selaginella moellendorffii]
MPERDTVAWNTLIAAYVQYGRMDEACKAFDAMEERTVVTWTTMIAGYGRHGNLSEAKRLFDRSPEKNGVEVNESTLLKVLATCSRLGSLDSGWRAFVSISQDYGLQATRDHYGCLIDLLGRAGWIGQAQELIDVMPFCADGAAWGSLLSASKVYHDVDCGMQASWKISELEPSSSAAYVELSNIYKHCD